jgi:hypothetical protein
MLILHYFHQQPILIAKTLTFQGNENLETKVYTMIKFFMNVSKMQTS